MSNLAVLDDLENNNAKDFLKNLFRDLSLKRLKKHSFIDFITQNDVKRIIENNQECQWVSVIFVKGENVQFIFKAQFVTEDAKHFAAKAYGKPNESKDINKHQADEFIKEFCNLMGGGIKEQLEKNGVKTIMSLPLLTRGQDDVFFSPNSSETYEDLFLDKWELQLEGKSLICEAFAEIYDKETLPIICNEVEFAEDEVEFF
tara:strand:- start:34 stop:639 length:606 start_codon:yes stop_codon:yes gene_type:complete